MPFPPTTDTAEQVTRKVIRNTAIAAVATYAVTFGLCIISTSATLAGELAVLPAAFAAPFVGGLITVVGYSRTRTT